MSDVLDPERRAARLVELEASLLDERRFEDWLSLYAPEGCYWMPASYEQSSPDDALSLLYEDRRLLALRVRRLASPVVHIEIPPSRTHHHLSAVQVSVAPGQAIQVDSMQWIAMVRGGEQRVFSARCRHRLVEVNGALLIESKTVRLLDCDSGHRGFAIPL